MLNSTIVLANNAKSVQLLAESGFGALYYLQELYFSALLFLDDSRLAIPFCQIIHSYGQYRGTYYTSACKPVLLIP